MFQSLGSWVSKTAPLIVIAWILILVVLEAVSPSWKSVSTDGELQHLPNDMPSRVGQRLMEKAFPEERGQSSIVLVMHRNGQELQQADDKFIADTMVPVLNRIRPSEDLEVGGDDESAIYRWLEQELSDSSEEPDKDKDPDQEAEAGSKKEPQVVSISSPENPLLGVMLRSEQNDAALVLIDLNSSFLETANGPIVSDVEDAIAKLQQDDSIPNGLHIEMTGGAAIGRDTIAAVTESTEAVRNYTFILVVILLLVVYRAPLPVLISFATLYIAVEVTLNVLTLLAQAGVIGLFDGLQLYTTVLVYGAGVDYGLFLISRHREELERDGKLRTAIGMALRYVGVAIAISAGTEMLGIGMLGFAEFGKFRQAGIGVALGLGVMLLASLTLTPALLRLCGRWAYWPLSRSAPYSLGTYLIKKLQLKKWLPDQQDPEESWDIWTRFGVYLKRWPLPIWGITFGILLPFALIGIWNYNKVTYGLVSELPPETPSVVGMTTLTNYFSPGYAAPVTVLLRDDDMDFRKARGEEAVAEFTRSLLSHQEELGITDVRGLTSPLGATGNAAAVEQALENAIQKFEERGLKDEGLRLKVSLQRFVDFLSQQYYVSEENEVAGHVTRLYLTLAKDPFSRESILDFQDLQTQIEELLPAEISDSQIYMVGVTSSMYDLRNVAEHDRVWITVLVTAAVLIVLVLLLKKPVLSIYLVALILFNYIVSLGVTVLFFEWYMGDTFNGLQWTVPLLLFTLLMAVGEDYNVVLVTRVAEEEERYGPIDGVTKALSMTGSLISGAGIVMAGTFFAMFLGGSLAGMLQLGFSLAFAVLLDTFIVRPILVPAYLILVHRHNLGWLQKLGPGTTSMHAPGSQTSHSVPSA